MDPNGQETFPGGVLPVVVIGNGPSGICMSYLLSGYMPYLSPEGTHPNAILQAKLEQNPHLSLLEQDLEYLCEGLEGRSSNPVAVLFDSLLLPDSDFGLDSPSPLLWRYQPERATPHLVLGRGLPGGAWHAMEGSMLTLSLARWMELPGLKLKDWVRDKRSSRNVRNDRATPAEVASYYQYYVTQMGLQKNFISGTVVTSLCRVPRKDGGAPVWMVQGLQRLSEQGEETECPFSLQAENVVLATGTHDVPARLGVDGEDLPFVHHSFWEMESALMKGNLDRNSDPVFVVGAGLTAADTILVAHHHSVNVYHAFRRSVTDPDLIFNQLPKVLYPEYHKVHQMMTQQQCWQGMPVTHPENAPLPFSGSYPGYVSFPKHHVVAFKPDKKCVLENAEGQQTILPVSMALVLIGAYPNLSFLPDDGQHLGLCPQDPISCRRNPLHVNPYTYESVREPGLYVMGPLVGENFVRFLKGGALAIASDLARRQRNADQSTDGDKEDTHIALACDS
ncbi:oxidative stress induced growth inhibitor 1 [Paramormyrops kingsleyae]|uniref:Oxidative stress-induced growth inhibitor 1 n=1 Tax=Paramormyrops kingsleyae TaxID=1676925 RepID=A0A3B3RQD5_9TELE|nr:oxidative stress-induced growth inhibitor 2-like [Paramormyrops kingsleyae]XP_023651266.1 oxidative stress-induced growth inhibitor 2-like [Paramormyrops kingsleyae]XP_023651267.1 oxidative stress-induced growth inhibitor 2-like [Paramormyrops kingsleyae]XP_023651268.1 oxidative stress-induced growth inhibitor 2-like [Paramormyrops kingsleyae]XP_023651269.1 oxidative stress-induced growth inhibitor 2-like [Paramormyrops kingsleyae]